MKRLNSRSVRKKIEFFCYGSQCVQFTSKFWCSQIIFASGPWVRKKTSQELLVRLMSSESGVEKFQFLVKLALENGAADAKVISIDKVIVENRVVLKCKVGCNHYGKTLACPPYTPSAEEFRKIVSEYSYAMFMKFTSKAQAEPEVLEKLMVAETDPTVPQGIKEKAAKFWQDWKDDKRKMLQSVVDLEKAAMNKGYSLAISFVSGALPTLRKM
jgi:predicted metal-binding protein